MTFKGIYNRVSKHIELYEGGNHGQSFVKSTEGAVDDKIFLDLLGDYYHKRLIEEIELLDMAGEEFSLNEVLLGKLTPIFFGSAMTNFGIKTFLEAFIKMAPCPQQRLAGNEIIDPINTPFSGFIFKIQANMNPAHRDRLAFLRVCSGEFTKGMEAWHNGKKIKLTQPTQFMAQERTTIEKAYAGDIIGLFDPGIFRIGDSLSESDPKLKYSDIPVFPSEHFARVSFADSMKRKQFQKGIMQLSQEGAIQVFKQIDIGVETLIVGAVGILQFDVLEYRLENEYGVKLRMQNLPYRYARWIEKYR